MTILFLLFSSPIGSLGGSRTSLVEAQEDTGGQLDAESYKGMYV